MIKYKEKEFEDYNIDPLTAVITDKNGIEQQIKINKKGRPMFKGIPVHQLMMHTFYGYKKGYDIHHLDENKLNNALSNLVYLTPSEHSHLHNSDQQFLERKRKACKETWANPELRKLDAELVKKAFEKNEFFSEKQAEYALKGWANEEKRKERIENMKKSWTPERRKKHAERLKTCKWFRHPDGRSKFCQNSPGPDWELGHW